MYHINKESYKSKSKFKSIFLYIYIKKWRGIKYSIHSAYYASTRKKKRTSGVFSFNLHEVKDLKIFHSFHHKYVYTRGHQNYINVSITMHNFFSGNIYVFTFQVNNQSINNIHSY